MRKYIGYFFILAAGLFYYLNKNRLPEITEEYYFWANLNYWLFLIPVFVYLRSGYKNEIYPFVSVLSLLLWLSFPLPVYFIHPESYQLSALSPEALEWTFWAYGTFFLAYYILLDKAFLKVKPFDPIRVSLVNPKIKHAALFFLLFWLLNKVLSLNAVYHLATLGFYFYIGTYLLLINKKVPVSPIEKLTFFSVLAVEYIIRALDGLLSPLALLTLFIALIDFYTKRKVSRILLLVVPFVFIFLVFSPIKGEFRREAWYSGKEYGLMERIQLIGDLWENKATSGPSTEEQTALDKEHFLWRYSYQASAFSLVLRETPRNVPYWDGESYQILSKFVPRFLWPDKPQENMGYKFGTRYGVMSIYNRSTSMNTPILTEVYMNFGYGGIFICMSLLAALYVVLNNYFNDIRISDIGKVYAIAFTFPFVIHESNFSLAFGNLPLLLICVYFVLNFYVNRS